MKSRTIAGPSAQNSSSPIFTQLGTPSSFSTSLSASARLGVSSAAINRFPTENPTRRMYHDEEIALTLT